MTYHPKDHPLPSAQKSAELDAAEAKYCLTAFDLVAAPLGSREWTFYWAGWHARSRGPTEPSEAQQQQHIISNFLIRTGQYLTNDPSREAAVRSAVDAALHQERMPQHSANQINGTYAKVLPLEAARLMSENSLDSKSTSVHAAREAAVRAASSAAKSLGRS
jgi:hypothetical protein